MCAILHENFCEGRYFREKAEEKAAMMRTRVAAAAAKSNSPSVLEASILSHSRVCMRNVHPLAAAATSHVYKQQEKQQQHHKEDVEENYIYVVASSSSE